MESTDSRNKLVLLVVGAALILTVLAHASDLSKVDRDLFHEMALARQIHQEGAVPMQDSFAYTPTVEKVVHHEWLTGVILYWVCVGWGGGEPGLLVLKYVLTLATTLACYCYLRRNRTPLPLLAVLAPVAMAWGGRIAFTSIRAQVFTLLFLSITFILVDIDRKGGRWWVAVWLPLVTLWANIHGGVVSGLGIMGCYGLAKVIEVFARTRSASQTFKSTGYLFVTGVATAAVVNINPYGFDYIVYLIGALRLPRPTISEWQPIWALPQALPGYACSVLVMLVAIAYYWLGSTTTNSEFKFSADLPSPANDAPPENARASRFSVSLFPIFALAITAYLAAKHIRHGSLFAVTWVCLVPPMLIGTSIAETLASLWRRYQLLVAGVAIVAAVLAVHRAVNNEFWKLKVPAQASPSNPRKGLFPVGPSLHLADAGFTGNLMTPFNDAAYISWYNPGVKVSIDSRYEVAYPPGSLETNIAFYDAEPGWRATLAQYPTDGILIRRSAPLAQKADELKALGWLERYRDGTYSLFYRADLARQYEYQDRSNDVIAQPFP